MEPTIYDITLELQRACAPWALTVKKGDTGRRLRLRLLSGGKAYPITDDCYAVFTAQKPDGTVIYNSCTREGERFVYDLTPQTTAAAGVLPCELRLYGKDDALLTSAAFTVTVEDTVYTEGDETVTSTGEATALTRLITQARDTIGEMEKEMEKLLANEVNHAVIDDTKAGADAWSGKNIADKLCPAFEESGGIVSCDPVEGYPLGVVTQIEPVQSGSGDPSPDNIRPIAGHTAVKLTRCGKNLANTTVLVGVNGITENDGVFSGTVRDFCGATKDIGFVPASAFAEGQQYVFSLDAKKGTAESTPYTVIKYTDGTQSGANITSTGEFARYIAVSTPGKTVQGVWISFDAGGTDTLYIKDIQAEKGTTATAYEPYRGETFTLDLGQTVYGGSLDRKTGVLTVDKGFVQLTSDFHMQEYGFAGYVGVTFGDVLAEPLNRANGICSHSPINGTNNSLNMWCGVNGNANIYWLGVLDALGLSSIEEFKAWLDTQTVQVCYELATPVTVQLTPQEILALSGMNMLYSDTGDTTVTGRADPAAVMEKLTNAIIALGGNV